MYRTSPKPDTPYAKTPLPDSPATKIKNMTLTNNQAIPNNKNNETLTARDFHNFSGTDDLSDEEIMKQIKNLQRLLKQRRKKKPAKRNLQQSTGTQVPKRMIVPHQKLQQTQTRHSAPPPLWFEQSATTLTKNVAAGDSQGPPPSGGRKTQSKSPANSSSKTPSKPPSRSPGGHTPRVRIAVPRDAGEETADDNLVALLGALQDLFSHVDKITAAINRLIPQAKHRHGRYTSRGGSVAIACPRVKTNWAKISTEIKRRGINFSKAQNIPDGIRIFPSTEADYRAITKFFSNDSIPYHTYQLPSEKLLNVVLRGIPVEVAVEEIFKDLRELGFTPELVVRMRRTRDKAPMPFVLVKVPRAQKSIYHLTEVPRAQKSIYHLTEVVSLEISVETLKAKSSIGQCFRCQKFEHAQSRCTAPRRYVACAEEHPPTECPRLKTEPATANCCSTCIGRAVPPSPNHSPSSLLGLPPRRRPNALGSKPNLPLQIVRVNTPLTTVVVSDSPSQRLFDLHWTGRSTQSKSLAKQSSRTPSKAPPKSPAGRTPKVRVAVPRDAGEETVDDNLFVLLGALLDLFPHVGKITTGLLQIKVKGFGPMNIFPVYAPPTWGFVVEVYSSLFVSDTPALPPTWGFVVEVYSSLFVSDTPALVAGDLNAKHRLWG
ncbi:hypothetical protein QE152_g24274 [Popillia japonica]|uniref:Gag-like protein n=1 Tax=Popillia japonica TaxID=7064 RepID=A0AAW1KGK4_POPJA